MVYIYLHEWLIFYGFHVGKYTNRPMDPITVRIPLNQSVFHGGRWTQKEQFIDGDPIQMVPTCRGYNSTYNC